MFHSSVDGFIASCHSVIQIDAGFVMKVLDSNRP